MHVKHAIVAQIFLIVLLCVVVYFPMLHNGHIWDDNDYAYENELLNDVSGLKDIWFAHKTPQYYPLVFTTFWIEHKLWGFDPFGYHLLSLILHAVNAILLLLLIRKIYPRAALMAAVIFAARPIPGSSVVPAQLAAKY
jgi:protein O-mannosyl-transferase